MKRQASHSHHAATLTPCTQSSLVGLHSAGEEIDPDGSKVIEVESLFGPCVSGSGLPRSPTTAQPLFALCGPYKSHPPAAVPLVLGDNGKLLKEKRLR